MPAILDFINRIRQTNRRIAASPIGTAPKNGSPRPVSIPARVASVAAAVSAAKPL